MMKLLRFIFYLFYRYYSAKGGQTHIAYFSTLMAVTMLIVFHIFQILILTNNMDLLMISKKNNRVENYFGAVLVLVPILVFLAFLVKESTIKNLSFSEDIIKRGNVFLLIYIISSFCLTVLLMLLVS